MASKTAQIIIAVDDKSLVQLNAEIKLLETSMKNLKVGTQEWIAQNQQLGTLKDKFKAATDQAKLLQGQVQKITGSDAIRGVAKLGAGMVGAFAAVNGTLTSLGIGGGKTMEAITAKGVQLMQIFGGLNQVAELFSKQTINSLKGIGIGFKDLIISVKGFSTATKAAIASTGIGVLLILIGALIANWDKLTAAINRNRKEKELAKDKERSEAEIKYQETIIGLEEKRIADQKKLNELNGEAYKNSTLDYELAKKRADLAHTEYQDLIIAGQQLELTEKEQKATLDKKIEGNKRLNELTKQGISDLYMALTYSDKKVEKAQEEYDKTVKLREENKVAQEQAIANYYTQEAILNRINKEETKRVLLEEKNAKISGLQDQIKILDAQGNKTAQIYVLQQKILNLEIAKLNDAEKFNGFLTEEEKIKKAGYLADKEALKISEDKRISLLKLEIQELKNQKRFEESAQRIAEYYGDQGRALESLNNEFNMVNDNVELYSKAFEKITTSYDEYVKLREEEWVLEKKKTTLIDDQSEQIANNYKVSKEAFIEIEGIFKRFSNNENFETFREELKIARNEARGLLEDMGLTAKKVGLNQQDIAANNIALQKLITDKTAEELNYLIEINKEKQKVNDSSIEEANLLIANNNELLDSLNARKAIVEKEYEASKKIPENLEAQKQSLDELAKLQNQINGLNNDNVALNNEITDLTREQNQLNRDNISLTNEISTNEEKRIAYNYKITAELEKQAQFHEKAQKWIRDNNEEIMMGMAAFANSMEAVAAGFDRAAAKADERIQGYRDDLDALAEKEKEIADAEAARDEKLLGYEEELKDANGERYDELLTKIDQVKNQDIASKEDVEKKRADIEAKIKAEEHKKAVAEHAAAVWRKTQAIVDGVIQTALSVIKALPNVFLSVATGIAGAAAVASIAAQRIPPIPESKKVGGFTAEGDPNEVAGIVHKSEYVVPAKVVKSPMAQSHIAALENQRLRGYQDGGMVTPNLPSYSDAFDYDRLASVLMESISKLPNPQVGLVNISQGLRDVELTKTQSGLTR